MIEIGKYNTLRIDRIGSPGIHLCDEENNAVLLPGKYILPEMKIDDMLRVFVYKDNEERPIATTMEPLITLNHFAFLEVADQNKFGAFLKWGIEKDLLLPYREQRFRRHKGDYTLVYMYMDHLTDRLVATEKISKFLNNENLKLEEHEEVNIIIWEETPLGYKVIVNEQHNGLLYKNEVFKSIKIGQSMKAYVKKIRPEGKIDIQLQVIGFKQVEDFSDTLYRELKNSGGYLPFNDRSEPAAIQKQFGVSKKVFKKATGLLYKQKKISLEKEGIKLELLD